MGEELLEIGVEQARAAREDGERGVVTHGAGGIGAVGEGGEDEVEFVGFVAEGELRGQVGRGGGVLEGGGCGVGLQVDEVVVAPLLEVGVAGEAGLDFLVVEEFAGGEVEGDHAAGAEATGLDDLAGEVVHEAGFGAEDDVAVVVDLVAGGAQAVAVEGGADDAAVGEEDRGGAVPGLHHAGVVAEEGLGLGGEGGVLFPGGGHHQHAGVQGVASAEGDELEGVVEVGGVAQARLDHGLEVVEAVAPDAVGGGVFAGAHEVAVAADGVDFAVVRHHPEGMGEVPGGEGVGRVALVEDGEGGGELGGLEVHEVFADLRGGEQALVNDGAAAEGADVEAFELGVVGLVLDGVLREEEAALELVVGDVVLAGDEGLDDEGLGIEGLATEAGGVDGDFAPAEEGEVFGLDGVFDEFAGVGLGVVVVAGDEDHADAEVGVAEEGFALGGEVVLKELDGELGEQAGAVAGDGIGVDGAAVGERLEGRDRAVENVIRSFSGQLRNEPDATGIVFLFSGIER